MGQSNRQQRGQVSLLTGTNTQYGNPITNSIFSAQEFSSLATWPASPSTALSLVPVAPTPVTINGLLGFEMSFTVARQQRGTRTGIFKYAIGGSTMLDWNTNNIVASAITWLNGQLALLTAQGISYTVAGVKWCLGESEDPTEVPFYASRGATLMAAVRAAYGAGLGLIVVEQPPSVMNGVQAQEALWVSSDPKAALVNTTSIPYENPPHWNVPSVLTIGNLEDAAAVSLGFP